MKRKFEVVDETIDRIVIFTERNNFPFSASLRVEERGRFIDFFYVMLCSLKQSIRGGRARQKLSVLVFEQNHKAC